MKVVKHQGQLVAVNDYVIERELGRGGFGVTFLASREGEPFAVKEMATQDARDEYKVMKTLKDQCRHHLLCPITLLSGPRTSYLVSEFIDGTSLERFLPRRANNAVTRGFLEAFLLQLTDALATIHDLNLAHRDLKPENVMLSRRGRAYHFTLIDFGLATSRGSRTLAGTALYTSPNVYELRRERRLITLPILLSADLFALGVTFYELVESGKYPYKVVDDRVSRTTPLSDDVRRIPYDLNARQAYPQDARATQWMKHAFELMTFMTVWAPYEGLFTAKALHRVLTTRDFSRLTYTVNHFDVVMAALT